MKDVYIVQPYKVGSATGKSLAIIVPAELVKEYKIGISTILALSPDNRRQKITIQIITRIADRFEKKRGLFLGQSIIAHLYFCSLPLRLIKLPAI
jgi:hypothetical protein